MDLFSIRLHLEEVTGRPFPLSHWDPDGAILLANWANWVAKETGDYGPKYWAFAQATLVPGVIYGWGQDEWGDPVFYLEGPCGFQVSAHDPYEELWACLEELNPRANRTHYTRGWNGRNVQPFAYEIARKFGGIRKRTIRVAIARG